jgi:NAD(P)H-hydrate epimerase
MHVLTGERMRKVDEATIARYCPGLELMERAGRRVAEFILDRYPADGFKAAIFVGGGNNGGDALVVARYLAEEGRACSIHYLKSPEGLPMDALKNYQRLQGRMEAHTSLKEINFTRPDWSNIARKDIVSSTLIVDGLFGTGLTRPLEGRARDVVAMINDSGLPVVSIDMPTGIHSDTGDVMGVAVRATQTVTMGFPKLGMLFHPGKSHVGELVIADLGFPDEVLEVNSLGMYLLDGAEAARRLPARRPDVHKYRAGTVVLVAGSRAYTGAVLLAAEAALRSGCGMVYAAVHDGIRSVIQAGLREAIVVPLPETADGTVASDAQPGLAAYLEKADAVVLGPGLGTHDDTTTFVQELAVACAKPLILDADGLNAFTGAVDRLKGLAPNTVLTPHSGELARLLVEDVPDVPLDRVETLCTKGHRR